MIIERKTPTGILYFDDKTHRFWKMVDGKKKAYTSVTQYTGVIDKPGLKYWAVELMEDDLLGILTSGKVITEIDILKAAKLHEVRKQEAADIGTKIHDWIDQWLNGSDPAMPEDPNVLTGITSFLDFQAANKVKWLPGEQITCSEVYGFAGKYDRIAIVDNKKYMVDFKSSNQVSEDYAFQTMLYQIAEEEVTGEKLDGRLVIRFAKESEPEYLARMKKKNDKRVKLGKEPNKVEPYKVFEPVFFVENEKDKVAALGLIPVKNRLKELSKWE